MKYYDKFSDAGYHSAFLTSFTFSGDTFENIVLNRLRGAECHNTHVISDFHMFKQELELYGPPAQAGLRYHLALHKRPNAFHPKIVLQFGKEKARLLVGSANLTVTGLAGNKELVDEIICLGADDPVQPILAYAARYIQSCFPTDDNWFQQGFRRALELSPWFSLGNATDRIENTEMGFWGIVHSERNTTAVGQFADLIGDDDISRLNIISPYWDEKLAALRAMSKSLKSPIIRLGIETGRGLFPAHSLKKIDNVSVYAVDEFAASRNIHAKVFVAEGREYDHVLSGSLNCSAAALLSTRDNPINAEFGLYRRVPKGQALKQLGLLESFKHKIDVSIIEPFRTPAETTEKSAQATHAQITLNQNLVTVILKDTTGLEPTAIQLSSTVAETNWSQLNLINNEADETWTAVVATEYQTANIANIVFKNGSKSEPLIICNVANLNSNSRSPSSQKIHRLLQTLNQFNFENLDIIEILLELQAAQKFQSKSGTIGKGPQKQKTRKDSEQESSVISFEDFMEFDNGRINEISQNFMGESHRYSHEATDTLNRLLGLITSAPVIFDDDDVDLYPTDPSENHDEADQEPSRHSPIIQSSIESDIAHELGHKIMAYRYNTADNLADAVDRFCTKISMNPERNIDVTDLTHARALVQIILANTKPLLVEGSKYPSPVLPVFDKLHKRTGWPRLIGRVAQSVDHAFKKIGEGCHELNIEIGDNRIVDSLAVLLGGGQLAINARKSSAELNRLAKDIERIILSMDIFKIALFKNSENSNLRFSEIQDALFEKFDDT